MSTLHVGDNVKTPYGEGCIADIRHDKIVVRPTHWNMAGGQKATLYLNVSDVKLIFKVGDPVKTVFGVGTIVAIRDHGVPYVIKLKQWQLASNKSPVLYLGENSLVRDVDEYAAMTKVSLSYIYISIVYFNFNIFDISYDIFSQPVYIKLEITYGHLTAMALSNM